MNYYEYLCDQITMAIDFARANNKTNKLVLYPFGQQGLLTKQILNWRYGIEEAFIIDEGLSKINSNIKSISYLSQLDTSEFLFIITSDNLTYWDEIRRNIRRYVREENIIDLYSCKPLMYSEPRIAALEVASREIYDRNIRGEAAEAGVYQGEFARYINQFFYDRKLYLFDTFEGFSEKDIKVESQNGYTRRNSGYFGDTSVDFVMSKMKIKDNIIVKKGYFPDTTEGVADRFCFVSLDMDLYQPIKAGLEYFYPRLNWGGVYIHS